MSNDGVFTTVRTCWAVALVNGTIQLERYGHEDSAILVAENDNRNGLCRLRLRAIDVPNLIQMLTLAFPDTAKDGK